VCGCRSSGRPERPGDQVLGRVAVGLVEQLVGLLRRVAEPDEALPRERARVVAAGDDDVVDARPAGDLLAQLDDDPLGGALADAGTAWKRALSPEAIALISSRGVPPERTARATFGPIDCTCVSNRNSSRSSSLA